MNILQNAINAHKAGHLQEAASLYRQHLRRAKKDFTALQLLGLVYLAQQQVDLAVKYMRESLKLQPNQPHVHNNLANCLKKQGDLAKAVEHYHRAITLNPDYLEARRNLALTLLEQNDFEQCEKTLHAALSRHHNDASLYNLLGQLKKAQRDYAGAIESYQTALRLKPDDTITEHNLGVALRLNNQPQRALQHYQNLARRNIQSFELSHNMGNAHADIGALDAAIGCYRQAITLNPGYVDAHRNLSALLWETGNAEEFVASYEQVFAVHGANDALILSHAETLLSAEQPRQALELLQQRQVQDATNPNYLDFLARCHMALDDSRAALDFHQQACQKGASIPHLLNFGITLLQTGAVERAESMLSQVHQQAPINQAALAYLTLCWRLLDDPREQEINNYEQLVRKYEIPLPQGFSDLAEFNKTLATCLGELHTSKHHPYDQTLRGGTQTQGNLFARTHPEIQSLVSGLTQCIHEHLQHIAEIKPPFPGFPQSQHFEFAGSWSVRLSSQGFHTMHIHPMGWFSSAYYVSLPDVISPDDKAGWLKFGEPDFTLPQSLPPQYFVQPEAGRLVLFPSWFWHGTVPFESKQMRTTVAFDIKPI